MKTTLDAHVECTAGTCGGRPRVAGTRIRVQDIYVWHELHGRTPDEIVADHPSLGLGDVHAALAYFFDHRDEVLAQMKSDDAFIEQLKAEIGPGPLASRLHGGAS